MPYILEPMDHDDVPEVARIERLCFSLPWPTSAYRRELRTPDTNRYIVARYIPPEDAGKLGLTEPTESSLTALTNLVKPEEDVPEEVVESKSLLSQLIPWRRNGGHKNGTTSAASKYPVVGYAGLWLMVDEGHVTTIGVHPDHRGRGVGELLFLGLTDVAAQMKAHRITLEVRVSNVTAQALYRKHGLEIAGMRKRYYSDNGEDAYIMWSEPLDTPAFRHRLTQLRSALTERMRASFHEQAPPARPVDTSRLQ